ncbi:TlpA family protein disulfide reductase [Mangrovimonas spongiae]|uniref:TlpA family protein disulfide reductase n=1 Tax=Mangrovimonas spongiae TaxID=2494697 RepID=A0A3R9UTD7_9FLAO|nr:TlpA disulfide reductase family protein [Mangrovimonas spongiae]RSK39674.1 TlpA family protein disulfide reductase [Mangrovimonas spongiae]
MIKKLVVLVVFICNVSWAQHTINGTFMPPEEFSYVFLYQATPKGANYVSQSDVSPEGKFSITIDSTYKKGIYKLVYALPPEDNNFDVLYNGKDDITLHFNLDKGVEYSQSKDNKLWASYQNSMEAANTTINHFYSNDGKSSSTFIKIFNTLKDAQLAFENAAKDNPMALEFIKANKPYIPTSYEDYNTYTTHVKTHFLDYLNFESQLLLSSDFLTNKVFAFVFGMSNTNSDYKTQIDRLTKKITTVETKTAYLEMLWQEFVNQGNDVMANYITDTYLLDFANAQNNTNLATMITTYKRTSKGSLAPNFDVIFNSKNTTLHNLNNANKYLVVFWSSTCGHCLKELPQLETFVKDIPKNELMVIALGMEDDDKNWLETIPKFPDFTHVLGLQKWNNPVAKSYGVTSTPTYFLLDKDKTIIAKPYDVNAVKEALKQ